MKYIFKVEDDYITYSTARLHKEYKHHFSKKDDGLIIDGVRIEKTQAALVTRGMGKDIESMNTGLKMIQCKYSNEYYMINEPMISEGVE